MKNASSLFLIFILVFTLFGLPTKVEAAWYNASWLYRVPIEINPDYVAADATNYPVYVDLNDLPAGFHTNVTADGGDIRMTTSDGTTEVARELVFYTAASDTGELHFLAPSISGTATTTFYLYYGNSGADDYALDATYGAENVWSDFVAVWHMQEASSTFIDSTANSNDATETSGTIPGTTGWLAGNARDFERIDSEYGTVANNASINIGDNHLSIRSAIKLESTGSNSTFLSRYNTSSLRSYELSYHNVSGNRFSFTTSGDGSAFTSVVANNFGAPAGGTWYWVVAQHDPTANTIDIRVNNGTADSASYSSGLYQNNQALTLGVRTSALSNYLDGLMDEVRIQKEIDITDDYLTTEYNNLSAPTPFYWVGAEEEDVSIVAPTVTTSAASSITSSAATLNGNITATGGENATQHGFAYGTDSTLVSVIATSTLGSYSGTGSFNTGVSSLSSNTTYYFRAYATNSGGTGYGSIQSFTTSAAWYNASWTYRVPIEVNPDYVDATLTDFPVYVDLNDLPAGFHTNVTADGGDIRMTTSDGTTEIARELVFYTAASDTGELHFKAPSLSGTATTTFYLYYGNSGADDYALNATYGAENTWRSEYKGVWHMQALNDLDSTTNDNDGTAQAGHTSGDVLTGGKLAGSYHNFDDGSTDYISVGSGSSLDITTSGITISSWINSSDTGYNTIFGAYNPSFPYNGYGFLTGYPVASKLGYWSGTALAWRGSSNTVTGAWTYVQAAADSSSVIFYKNGASDGSTGGDHNPNLYSSTKYIGSVAAGTNPFAGDIDELRIYAGKLADTWLSTEYDNQNTPTPFYWVGAEEENPDPPSTRIIRLKGGTRLRGIRLR